MDVGDPLSCKNNVYKLHNTYIDGINKFRVSAFSFIIYQINGVRLCSVAILDY